VPDREPARRRRSHAGGGGARGGGSGMASTGFVEPLAGEDGLGWG
jgi:hypothetical protein